MTAGYSKVATTGKLVEATYQKMAQRVDAYRKLCQKPLSFAEKILVSHSSQPLTGDLTATSFCHLTPDRLAMQDATAQMALLQFIQSQKSEVELPSSVHCDHLILAHQGADHDLTFAQKENREVFDFLKSASEKYGIGFWAPGSGIIHQIVLENYAFPGGLMLGTDSHTPNAGGLGMAAVGVGGADAVDVMVGMPWELATPKVVAVKLTGKLSGWSSPKDVILKLLDILTVKGGKDIIFEYIGEGTGSISCTGKATITNMGAELGATTSLFPYDSKMEDYLNSTHRSELASLATQYADYLKADPEALIEPQKAYADVIEIDLNTLEPHIVGPHSPDVARPVSQMKTDVIKNAYPDKIAAALIGSCTNSSYEDIYKATSVAKNLLAEGIKAKVPFFITPGSATVYETVEAEGMLSTLQEFGGVVLANACGPCIGQWRRDDIVPGEENSIVTSFNRNFRGRNDANKATLGFITSPEMVVAYAASGSLSFDPMHHKLTTPRGDSLLLEIPKSKELPAGGLKLSSDGYFDPPTGGGSDVTIAANSQRLQILSPFTPWDGKDFIDHLLLFKAAGKCTTDHISPAGKWLRYRGHLDRISDNLLLGASHAFADEIGKTKNQLVDDGQFYNCSDVAREYKKAGRSWIIVGAENYGEGSSREHAAMTPRFLGCSAVIVQSFARIHATNLKKQGVLALTFANPDDYHKIGELGTISILGLAEMSPGAPLTLRLRHHGGGEELIEAHHSYNREQIKWFQSGSALNALMDGGVS